MSLLRALSGTQLIAMLGMLGHAATRRRGCHIGLRTDVITIHHRSNTDHGTLKVGTLSAILREVAQHHGMDRDQLAALLF